MAFLRFENLTADPSLDWIAAAAPGVLAAELTGGSRVVPLRAETVRDAYLESATRIVHGYFDRRAGKLHFEIAVEDPDRRKMVSTAAAEGETLSAMNSVAMNIAKTAAAGARAFSTSNAAAASAWGHGHFEEAVALDPDFGEAWVAWTAKLAAAGDSTRARFRQLSARWHAAVCAPQSSGRDLNWSWPGSRTTTPAVERRFGPWRN